MTTTSTTPKSWTTIAPEEQSELDAQYLRELSLWVYPGLTEQGVDAYLAYRHQRPEHSITTFEEGQIRRLLHPFIDQTKLVDPVALEEHRGRLEKFGAERLHLTNDQTYVAIMVTLNLVFLVILLIMLM
jgi:hypothetical protein